MHAKMSVLQYVDILVFDTLYMTRIWILALVVSVQLLLPPGIVSQLMSILV